MRLLPRRIAPRLILAVTALVALGGAISAWISASDLKRQLIREKITAADQLSRSITRATWTAMQSGRKDDAYEVMRSIRGQPGVRAIRMFNGLGRMTFTTEAEEPRTEPIESHTCQVCHKMDPPLDSASASDRARFVSDARGHTLDMVTAIFNEPSCSTADCHAHDHGKKVLGVLDVGLDVGYIDDEFRGLQLRAAAFALAKVLLIAGFLALFISRVIGRPIRRLIDGTRAIAAMDLDHPLPAGTTTELGDLTDSFERMRQGLKGAQGENARILAQLERQVDERGRELQATQERLVQSDRLASLGQLAASVAHEVNNPISAVHNLAIFLQRILGDQGVDPARLAAFRRHLVQIADESARAGKIVQDLLSFARRSSPQRAPASLNALVRTTLEIVKHRVELARIDLVLELAPDMPPVPCDRSQVEQVIMNLALNAVEAMREGGRLTIRTGVETATRMAILQVEDTGPGIPQAHIMRIFDPFFSTKQGEKGVGLGLSVVYGIVEAHDGRLSVHSQEGKGAVFTVRLPLQIAAPPPGAADPRTP